MRGEHHLTNAFEDHDLLLHGPWLSVGVRRPRLRRRRRSRGCGNVEVEGAEGPRPATNAQVEGHPARDQANVRADGRCAGDGSTCLVAYVSRRLTLYA